MPDDGIPDDPPPLRIGTAERDAALGALDVHLEAGRLDADEYGERYAQAGAARTRAELDALFGDLPAPHPSYDAAADLRTAGRRGSSLSVPTAPGSVAPPHGSGSTVATPSSHEPLFGRAGTTVVAVMPFVALVLFFATHYWEFFLLVPAAGAIVYGAERDHDKRRRR